MLKEKSKARHIAMLCLFTFFLFTQVVDAQTVRVIDLSDKQPVQNAIVLIPGQNRSLLTNEKGEANLTGVNKNDSIYIRHAQYLEFATTLAALEAKNFRAYLTESVFTSDEIVLSANKKEEKEKDLPQRIDIINRKQISFVNPQTTGDLLQRTGKIFLQTSQMGGGSPVLRGFEANKVLMVVDGVRMNNAIYRGGHLQSVITIDPNSLERVEIIYGPGSVIYGSDALGGVMHFYTRNPSLSTTDKPAVFANGLIRYATANQEKTGNISFSAGWKKFGSFTAITYKTFGDLRMGEMRPAVHGDWGKRLYYAQRIDGKDSQVVNENPLIQYGSGYNQYDVLQKFLFQPDSTRRFIINLQLSNSSDIPRYDRLSEIPKGKLKYAEWYYGPNSAFWPLLRVT
jgi:hemoglobin/transferrin/lactoferrin receptor protein